MLKTIELADVILQINIDSHENDKMTFFATEEEIICLRDAGAKVVRWNYDQGDGTLTCEVKYKEYLFLSSSTEQIL